MTELRIYPDPVLRSKAHRVEKIDLKKIEYVTSVMEEIIKVKDAVGLAAPQVGILEQIIVVMSNSTCIKLINPELIEYKGDETIEEEGCLSIPGVEVKIGRSPFVVIKGIDENGVEKVIEAKDLFARTIQHEIDHLNGVLIIDRFTPIERIKFDLTWRQNEERDTP